MHGEGVTGRRVRWSMISSVSTSFISLVSALVQYWHVCTPGECLPTVLFVTFFVSLCQRLVHADGYVTWVWLGYSLLGLFA